jgi:hypothetical protein
VSPRHRLFMFERAFKNIDDVLWKAADCSSELDAESAAVLETIRGLL